MVVGYRIPAAPRTESRSHVLTDSAELRLFVLSRRLTNCQPRTLETYQYHIGRFLGFARKPVGNIEKSDVELYLLGFQERQCSPHYIRSVHRNLSIFFGWLVAEEMLRQSPMRSLPRPKVPRRGKDFLSREDFERLLAVCPNNFVGVRNRSWLWLLWSTGCRLDGLVKLKQAGLDWKQSRIRVIEKGNKERYVPFTPDAQTAVWRYLKTRVVYMKGRDQFQELWIGEERQPMKYHGLQSVMRLLINRAGLTLKDHHHIFRRTWAYRNLKAGVPVKFVQLVGGWSDLATMEGYVRAMQSDDALNVQWY